MTKKDLRDILSHWITFAHQRQARADELLVSNDALLSRARDAEIDRRLALELLGKCGAAMRSSPIRDEVVAFVKERGL